MLYICNLHIMLNYKELKKPSDITQYRLEQNFVRNISTNMIVYYVVNII